MVLVNYNFWVYYVLYIKNVMIFGKKERKNTEERQDMRAVWQQVYLHKRTFLVNSVLCFQPGSKRPMYFHSHYEW